MPSMPAEAEGIYAEFRALENRHDPERNRRRRELWRKLDRLRGTAIHFDQVQAFAHDLIDAGMHPGRLRQAAMVSRKTLRRRELHRNGGHTARSGVKTAYSHGAGSPTKRGTPYPTPAHPRFVHLGAAERRRCGPGARASLSCLRGSVP